MITFDDLRNALLDEKERLKKYDITWDVADVLNIVERYLRDPAGEQPESGVRKDAERHGEQVSASHLTSPAPLGDALNMVPDKQPEQAGDLVEWLYQALLLRYNEKDRNAAEFIAKYVVALAMPDATTRKGVGCAGEALATERSAGTVRTSGTLFPDGARHVEEPQELSLIGAFSKKTAPPTSGTPARDGRQVDDAIALLRVARSAAQKLYTMYKRREVEPRSELDGLIAKRDKFFPAIRALATLPTAAGAVDEEELAQKLASGLNLALPLIKTKDDILSACRGGIKALRPYLTIAAGADKEDGGASGGVL